MLWQRGQCIGILQTAGRCSHFPRHALGKNTFSFDFHLDMMCQLYRERVKNKSNVKPLTCSLNMCRSRTRSIERDTEDLYLSWTTAEYAAALPHAPPCRSVPEYGFRCTGSGSLSVVLSYHRRKDLSCKKFCELENLSVSGEVFMIILFQQVSL